PTPARVVTSVDLPDPVTPPTHISSPALSVKVTPSMARVTPPWPIRSMTRSEHLIGMSLSAGMPPILPENPPEGSRLGEPQPLHVDVAQPHPQRPAAVRIRGDPLHGAEKLLLLPV